MMDIFDKIFEDKVDREVNRNIVDIYSSLTNVGWDCTKLIDHIEDYLDKDSYEDLETGIDILKSLVEEKEEICEEIIIKKM